MEEDKYPNNLAEIQVDSFFRARKHARERWGNRQPKLEIWASANIGIVA